MTIIVAAKNLDGILACSDTARINGFCIKAADELKVRPICGEKVIVGMSGLFIGKDGPNVEYEEWDSALGDASLDGPLRWVTKRTYPSFRINRMTELMKRKRRKFRAGFKWGSKKPTSLLLNYIVGFVDKSRDFRLFESGKDFSEPCFTEKDCCAIGWVDLELKEFLRRGYCSNMNSKELEAHLIAVVRLAKYKDKCENGEKPLLSGLSIGQLTREGYRQLYFSTRDEMDLAYCRQGTSSLPL